jgi:GNAT superfamily N-acetyltransferase
MVLHEGSFRISAATKQDVALVLSLIQELADYEGLSDAVSATEISIERALFSEDPEAEVRIAWLADEVVGFALFFRSFSTFLGKAGLYLEDLYVKKSYRGRGYGRRLLAHLASIAVSRGYGRFEWSVLEWNQLAISSYRRAGAVPMNEWTVYRLAGDSLHLLAAEDGQQ